jgi:uncharacterized protein YjeT (DUF2065 family)
VKRRAAIFLTPFKGFGYLSPAVDRLRNREFFLKGENTMKWVLMGISLVWIASGVCLVLYTTACRKVLAALLENMNAQILGALALVVGVLLLLAATASQNFWFVVLLAGFAAAKGVLLFINPRGFFAKIRRWYLKEADDQTYRMAGIILLVLGTAVFSWIK